MAKVIEIPFDSPEVDSMLAGADWKLLSPEESIKLRTWLQKNSAGRAGQESPAADSSPKPSSPTPSPSEEQPPAD
jgi:hypothetical protein